MNGKAVLILKNGAEIAVEKLGGVIDATKMSGGYVIHNPPKSCGATGIEAAPVLVFLILRKWRAHRARAALARMSLER